MTPPEVILQSFFIVGAVIGFTEWRYRVLHNCVKRIETRLDKHLDK